MGPPQATVLGRGERVDILHAATAEWHFVAYNRFRRHALEDCDPPAGPVASAILALAEDRTVSGVDFLHAFALGVEVECRIGNAVYPSHYDVGWHITGPPAYSGRRPPPASSSIERAADRRGRWASPQPRPRACARCSARCASRFHLGSPAKNGLAAAFLARDDFTSSSRHRRQARLRQRARDGTGFQQDHGRLERDLGTLLENTYKPFACGIVIHPTIDGCAQLRNEHGLKAHDIASIDLKVHPLVLELTGKTNPQVGLEGKFSVYHSCGRRPIDGVAGEAQFYRMSAFATRSRRAPRPRAARRPWRDRDDAARSAITLNDGRILEEACRARDRQP